MKNIIAACFCFALYLAIVGCMQSDMQTTATVVPTIAIATTSSVDPSSRTQPVVPDQSALPTVVLNTPVVATPVPYTPDVDQFDDPYFQPTEIPGLLHSHLTIETLQDFNGASMQRITGWRYGFESLEWMDSSHLLLYPYAGIYSIGGGQRPGITPVVVSLDTSTFWLPLPNQRGGNFYPTLPRWSEELGVLIAAGSATSVAIHSPDGTIAKVYEGTFLGVSPSATKLIIDDRWIDLSNDKTVQFAWQQDEIAANYAGISSFRPIWSPDETRVYACCYRYGNAKTGESQSMPYYDITLDGEKTQFMLDALYGTWVLNDKYMLPVWGGTWDGRYGTIYLFDPAAKTYRNLSALAGITYEWNGYEPYCNSPSAQSGGRYVWVDCLDGGHLIDLATFHSRGYPPPPDGPYGGGNYTTLDTEWSADGNFVWFNKQGSESILSGATGELKPLPQNCYGFEWHPKDNILLCMSNGGKNLLLLDAQTISPIKETILPTRFFSIGWSPDGKLITLLAQDANSLWQINYPDLNDLKQVTPPMPELTRLILNDNAIQSPIENIVWSPDNSAVAFIGAQDIYIVQSKDRP